MAALRALCVSPKEVSWSESLSVVTPPRCTLRRHTGTATWITGIQIVCQLANHAYPKVIGSKPMKDSNTSSTTQCCAAKIRLRHGIAVYVTRKSINNLSTVG